MRTELLNSLTGDQKAELVNEMRNWIKECNWQDVEDEDVDNMTDEELIRGINNHYSGGIDQFIKDSI